jgi:hypothetical protein
VNLNRFSRSIFEKYQVSDHPLDAFHPVYPWYPGYPDADNSHPAIVPIIMIQTDYAPNFPVCAGLYNVFDI